MDLPVMKKIDLNVEGAIACWRGLPVEACPYPSPTEHSGEWVYGWLLAYWDNGKSLGKGE